MNLVQPESLLSSASTAELYIALQRAKAELDLAKENIQSINNEILSRFQTAAQNKLHQQGKDFGSTTLYDKDLKITVNFKKKVEWDQQKLVTILNSLDAETARHYADARYTVPENKYTAAPPEIKSKLSDARTVHLQSISATVEGNENA